MKISTLHTAVLGLAALAKASYINYTTVTGYFMQDEVSTDPSTFVYYEENFGLINRTYEGETYNRNSKDLTQWQRFYNEVVRLNQESPCNVEYKVFFFGRHGDGYHNDAQAYYGTPAWNCYWAEIDGNDTTTWHDAALSQLGVEQAQTAHNFWQQLIVDQRIHTPDAYFTSPLTRCLQTANVTFEGLELPRNSASFKPMVKELFREGISIHTCDNRRSKNYIHNLFPEWIIESGFTINDELWNGITAETTDAQNMRSKKVLDEVFEELGNRNHEQNLFVSVTSHSGEIGSILSVLGHRTFSLNTGAVIPVLIRAETQEKDVVTKCHAWTVSAHCTTPPATSLANCVCASSAAAVTTPLVTMTSEPSTTSGPVCYDA
ncbi:uncharacterized protein PFLUO_LOCUS7293 [Penicillium psychrofluorescens]|uniref:uncharacterized protein n=1 Tax=Penicillium psychrofluorescens TaxID=3158075 RepID=UPI003CCD2EE0